MSRVADALSRVSRKNCCRWFVRQGPTTYYDRGFRKKSDASEFISAFLLDWRVGFRFRVKGDSEDAVIVNRKGEEAQP